MAYRLKRRQSVAANIARIADEQIEKALAELADDNLDPHEVVHQVRKRCKKIRALLRLVRPALGKTYAAGNAWFRDAGGELSRVRDAQSAIETYDALMERFADQVNRPAFASVRRRLTLRKQAIAEGQVDLDDQLRRLRGELADARKRVKKWSLDEKGFGAVAGGLSKTYARARKAMKAAYEAATPEAFHEWRKRAKYHWYHLRLIHRAWPKVLGAYRKEAHRLADMLGDEHDLTVLRDIVRTEPGSFGRDKDVEAFLALAARRQAELRKAAAPLGKRLLAEKPKAFRRRIKACWKPWRRQG